MDVSINSDFINSTGDVEEPLRLISEAGFKYIHWCHHWFDDYLYSNLEVLKIKKLLREYGLQLYDLHSSQGIKKYWCSTDESKRLAGEELLLNRIRMTHDLGGRAIVLHTNTEPLSEKTKKRAEQGVKTLLSLEPHCRELGIRIGVENLFDNLGESSLYDLNHYFSNFSSDFIGFCWDTGHSNMIEKGIDRIEALTRRLAILHVNGNRGEKDEHLPIGYGNLDWDRVAKIIASSSYDGVLTQEVVKPQGVSAEKFLKDVYDRGVDFALKIESMR